MIHPKTYEKMKSRKFLENANMQDAFYMYPPPHDFVNESLFFRRKRENKERERKGIGKKENECPPIGDIKTGGSFNRT